MINIHLHGALKKLISCPPLALDVHSPAEALRALCAVLPGFSTTVRSGDWRITADTEALTTDTLTLPFGSRQSLHVYPAAAGAGLETIGAAAWGWIIAGVVAVAAIVLTPRVGDYSERDAADQRNSYLFNGGVNSQEQGGVVPLIYGGPMRVGSVVVSAGIESERVVQYNYYHGYGYGYGFGGYF